jgi:hypothetical protein
VVSGGELQRVLRASRKPASKVVFSGVGKTAAEMELALRSGILLFNIESASELNLARSNRDAKLTETRGGSGARQSRRFGENSSLYFDRSASAQIRRSDSRGANALRRRPRSSLI